MGIGFQRFGRVAALVAVTLSAPLLQGSVGRSTNLEQRLLAAHNRERSAAGLAMLDWDPALAADAADWARELAASGAFEHSPEDPDDEDPQGENLWMGTKGAYSPEDMVGMWIEEKKDFRPGTFPNVSRTGDYGDVGHYTQLMWHDTGTVGCAVAKGREDEVLVCRYLTGGNVIGERVF
jgi:hypothetical protein